MARMRTQLSFEVDVLGLFMGDTVQFSIVPGSS